MGLDPDEYGESVEISLGNMDRLTLSAPRPRKRWITRVWRLWRKLMKRLSTAKPQSTGDFRPS